MIKTNLSAQLVLYFALFLFFKYNNSLNRFSKNSIFFLFFFLLWINILKITNVKSFFLLVYQKQLLVISRVCFIFPIFFFFIFFFFFFSFFSSFFFTKAWGNILFIDIYFEWKKKVLFCRVKWCFKWKWGKKKRNFAQFCVSFKGRQNLPWHLLNVNTVNASKCASCMKVAVINQLKRLWKINIFFLFHIYVCVCIYFYFPSHTGQKCLYHCL